MPEIESNFSMYRVYISGKLAGGTKRTKFHSIGFGTLPIQSLTTRALNQFFSYTHVYGEFGVKLLACKRRCLLKANSFQRPHFAQI